MRRLHYALLCLAVGSQLLLGTAGSSFVLCEESDGASALEWGLGGCCDLSSPVETKAGESLSSLEDCGACADGALELSLQRGDDATVPALIATPSLVAHEFVSVHRPLQVAVQTPRVPPGLASLRTVALRC